MARRQCWARLDVLSAGTISIINTALTSVASPITMHQYIKVMTEMGAQVPAIAAAAVAASYSRNHIQSAGPLLYGYCRDVINCTHHTGKCIHLLQLYDAILNSTNVHVHLQHIVYIPH